MLRFLWRFVAFLAEMNGYTPFFQALFKAYLAIIVGGLSVLSGWVCSVFGMLIVSSLIKCIYSQYLKMILIKMGFLYKTMDGKINI